MKTFKNYKSGRPFRRPDRHDPSKDYALGITMLGMCLIGVIALAFLIAFTRGG